VESYAALTADMNTYLSRSLSRNFVREKREIKRGGPMQISENAEEALEKLWTSLVEKGKSSISEKGIGDTKVLEELKSARLIKSGKDGVKLTIEGKKEAERVIRRHRLSERMFHDMFRMGKRDMESPACQFEHILISDEVEEAVCTLLGHPRECPHGRKIPQGDCCKEKRESVQKLIYPLSEVKNGQTGKVTYILSEDHQKLKKLMAMGVLPGRKITLIQKSPSYVFSVGRTQIAVDKDIASSIYVRVDKGQWRKRHRGR
jgi:DtxR family Mn-dependent transcriptional regulator